ncbi:ISAs1 family transposase [Streptosporangium sp. NPDC002607]
MRVRAGLPGTIRMAASTRGRLSSRLDGDAFDTATCGYLTVLTTGIAPGDGRRQPRPALVSLALEGKTSRGSNTTDVVVRLLAATRHNTQVVLAQRRIEARSNEIPAFAPLLPGVDLTGVVVIADALHTQHEHARQIITADGHYLFIVKGKQPTLHRRLKACPGAMRCSTTAPTNRDTAAARSAV